MYTIVLQALVDHDGYFCDVFSGIPGSVNDRRVFRMSGLGKTLAVIALSVGSVGKFVLADNGYNLRVFMLVGHGTTLDAAECAANDMIDKTRYVVENAFGRLKSRFRRLKYLEL
mmetsp:Transcript_15496/g.35941  ORF Transcript_15496/g.35941 Transcript_15496/m.35941 type:complete len:114 (-) Transcript_15496:316-657(-)